MTTVAVLVAALAVGASGAGHRKLQQPFDEGSLVGSTAELVLDMDFTDTLGGVDTFGLVIAPIAALLDAPLGAAMEPVYQFMGTLPGFDGCAV